MILYQNDLVDCGDVFWKRL
ncbi:putative proline-rich receptor-like protein kinase PERK3 [Iris pallida]|uniref:Proline-rich receptor-like protein kinase PERK3 n=1 Tax=Iris pallida TaxID=29817 RepID=A0AAX6G3I3_IRIPA|nr:putative proline-rich receptor-like protein kinase PERK3 [Iris pallida]KAJ6853372.1 putative proline-rich receptor-like protein kinase PERK3 [Iris pallida]